MRPFRVANNASVLVRPNALTAKMARDLVLEVDANKQKLLSIWNNRPNKDTASSISFLLGMAGLTPSWNDTDIRNLQEVLAKLEEAAQLAEELGV